MAQRKTAGCPEPVVSLGLVTCSRFQALLLNFLLGASFFVFAVRPRLHLRTDPDFASSRDMVSILPKSYLTVAVKLRLLPNYTQRLLDNRDG